MELVGQPLFGSNRYTSGTRLHMSGYAVDLCSWGRNAIISRFAKEAGRCCIWAMADCYKALH